MHTVNSGSWVDISEGCPIHCRVEGSNEVHVLLATTHECDLTFDREPLRDLVTKASAALAEMDALAAQETAERQARQQR